MIWQFVLLLHVVEVDASLTTPTSNKFLNVVLKIADDSHDPEIISLWHVNKAGEKLAVIDIDEPSD